MSLFSRVVLTAVCLVSMIVLGVSVKAGGADKRQILHAAYSEFPPYEFTDAEGVAQGYGVDLLRTAAGVAGYEIEFVAAQSPEHTLTLLEQGEVDLTLLLALTPERQTAGRPISGLGEYVLSVYVRRDSTIDDIAGLSGLRIGIVADTMTQSAENLLPEVTLIPYQTSDSLLLPLLRGELDGVVAVAETFDARLRINFIEDKVSRLDRALVATEYGMIVRRDLVTVHAALARTIAMSEKSGMLQVLHARWFGHNRSIYLHPWFENVAIIVGGIALTTFALVFYAARLRRRSAALSLENDAHQLVNNALDKIGAAITIFDSDLRALHWNDGFEARFPALVPYLEAGTTLDRACALFYELGILGSGSDGDEIDALATTIAHHLRGGEMFHRIVHTQMENSFDLSIFPLGSRFYAAIWVDVTVMHQQQKQLSAQSIELSHKNQQLLAFSAMAAHDLKAPLTQQQVVVEFITEDLLEAQLSLPAEAQGHFATLGDLSARMSRLVSELLDYAKADTRQAPAQCFSPNTRIEGIIKLAAAGNGMNIEVMEDIPAVQVEPVCFDMVMRNLITNAAKHHDRPDGTIIVRGHRERGEVIIEIEDDGPGIKAMDQARVFEPFARLTAVQGSGLGLAFVQRTVAAWGGSVTLRSAPNRGCIFRLSVPAAQAKPAGAPLPVYLPYGERRA
ncbi:ATP-binding protein [Sulfitobacter guttiformis]|uniref:histidine kinase n=1 Tax=Sulfitobacter guttiformis TaxID=74349 RepID=A0A420DTP1_9RHOB|nr:transporter substrate-binding domain-containing protein [Sulfitobacter guttiformis]KIN71221.1 Two-component system sensor-like protein [Sulfitobacter guttiformis KCTC 32187]RKE97691.1 amino acid-binding domain sensor histidine kinase [Sulfitobacter guttiformis]